jgi:hypothetical protein
MARSFIVHADAESAASIPGIGMRPVYLDIAANIAVTGDMSIFDGPLVDSEPAYVNTAQAGGGKTYTLPRRDLLSVLYTFILIPAAR